MKKMNNVMTIRLSKEDVDVINEIAIKTDKDKSTTVRELVELGKKHFAIMEYKEGRLSLGKAAEIARMPLAELIELLSQLGIPSMLEVKDYLAGKNAAEKIVQKRTKAENVKS